MNKQTQEVPLIELLKAVPKTARLIVDSADGISSTVHPIGHLCHEAAEALEQPAPPAKTTSLEDVIKEFEKDPEMKALLDLARKQVKGMKLEQPAKKPYGWYDNHDIHNEKQSDESIALYTHPHQWQGLTDDEIDKCGKGLSINHWPVDFARAIEQALKEKNT